MGNVSPHFSRHELMCPCGCGHIIINYYLVKNAELLRYRLKLAYGHYKGRERRIHVNSWCRCWDHNTDVGGSRTSKHPLGRAMDLRSDGLTAYEVHAVARTLPAFQQSGLILYNTFLHVDVGREYPYHRNYSKWRLAA